jgi:xanthine dehydrogenase accessory factor
MRAAGLTEVQLARLVCPIGIPGLESKDPAVIAASTAAQLLIVSESLAAEEDRAPSARCWDGSRAFAR